MILLSGARGFIGTRLRPVLTKRGAVLAVTRRPVTTREPGITWLEFDLTRPELPALPAQIDTIVYAAQSGRHRDVPEGCADMVAVNVAGLLSLIDAGRARGLRRVVYLSTGSVYARSTQALTESDPVAPESFYALTKRLAELALDGYGATIECTILRLFTVYGEGQHGMLIPGLFARLDQGEPTRIGPEGGLLLSPVYVDDVCTAVDAILAAPPEAGCRVFNVGGPDVVTLQQLAVAVGEAAGREPVFDVDRTQPRGGWAGASETLRRAYGWTATTRLRDGLGRVAAARTLRDPIHAGEMS